VAICKTDISYYLPIPIYTDIYFRNISIPISIYRTPLLKALKLFGACHITTPVQWSQSNTAGTETWAQLCQGAFIVAKTCKNRLHVIACLFHLFRSWTDEKRKWQCVPGPDRNNIGLPFVPSGRQNCCSVGINMTNVKSK
jgi:hypothetical protein